MEAATQEIDNALADRLTGIDNDDKLIELAGLKFQKYYANDRVSHAKTLLKMLVTNNIFKFEGL